MTMQHISANRSDPHLSRSLVVGQSSTNPAPRQCWPRHRTKSPIRHGFLDASWIFIAFYTFCVFFQHMSCFSPPEKNKENLPKKLTSNGFSGIAAKAESLGAVSIARMPLKATVQAWNIRCGYSSTIEASKTLHMIERLNVIL